MYDRHRISKRLLQKTRLISIAAVASNLLALTGTRAFAWFDFGHEVVACLAWRQLKPSTKDRVLQLLAKNPYFEMWTSAVPADVTGDEKNMWIFAQAATWPDVIKKDPKYTTDG